MGDGTNTLVTYQYDKANQLIRETNVAESYIHVWTYDDSGNILTRTEYAYTDGTLGEPTNTVAYTYGKENWGDQLSAVGDRTFTYDNIGNPLSDGKRTYVWERGRQLATLTQGETQWTNTYNSDGLRVKRTDGTNTYLYQYCDGDMVCMSYNGNNYYFSYTPDGVPFVIRNNEIDYLYITNLQGDVMAILTEAGTPVVEYTYDAWGNVLSVTGSMADTLGQLNPLRYRGYTYDRETGLYYLQSRYYDPELGRFINADAFISTGQGILGNNMYAYCNNNPILLVDSEGLRPIVGMGIQNETVIERKQSFSYMKKGKGKDIEHVDLTPDLDNLMQESAQTLQKVKNEEGSIADYLYFYNNVKDYGDLDIKRQSAWEFESGKKYYYRDMELRYDDPGNINFGYVGAVIFDSVEVLCIGAGLNQISNHGFAYGDITTWFDDPRDQDMIRYGYSLYVAGR